MLQLYWSSSSNWVIMYLLRRFYTKCYSNRILHLLSDIEMKKNLTFPKFDVTWLYLVMKMAYKN